jgi:hypothetical protein
MNFYTRKVTVFGRLPVCFMLNFFYEIISIVDATASMKRLKIAALEKIVNEVTLT